MSVPQPPTPAKAVVSLVMKDTGLLEPAARGLGRLLGDIDLVSAWLPFDYTDYYAGEMGTPLVRRMLVFKDLIAQDRLAELKQSTNELESRFAADGRRRVNIDPGYLLRERFVLASGKNFSHRIYIGGGIFADLSLVYRRGAYHPLDWTYPDYADAPMRAFLEKVRNKYVLDLKGNAPR
jgi:hypothetical protein